MKDRLIKGFGFVMFYALVMSCCIFVGAMVYLTASNLLPVPEGLPASLPTRGPSPTSSPTITPTPTPAPFSIEILNRTDDETIGDRIASYLSDAGYTILAQGNVDGVSSGSSTTAFGDPHSTKICVNEFSGPERALADDICRVLDIYCNVWDCSTGDAKVLLELGPKEDWISWLLDRGY